jgi:hypothetical protein
MSGLCEIVKDSFPFVGGDVDVRVKGKETGGESGDHGSGGTKTGFGDLTEHNVSETVVFGERAKVFVSLKVGLRIVIVVCEDDDDAVGKCSD